MTERWQRELKKLGHVEAPLSRIRAQIANGPSEDPSLPEPSRSPGQRITAGVVAFAVFAAAGVFAYRALKPSQAAPGAGVSPTPSDEPTGSDVVILDIGTTSGTIGCPGGPRGAITYGDQSTKGAPTSYTWNCPGSSMVADTVAPSFSSEDFVQVPVGVHLAVSGDSAAAEATLETFQGDYPWPTAHEVGDLAVEPALSFEPGLYIIEVTAHWPNGSVHFYFPIELVQPSGATPPPSTIPDVLKVECRGGAPTIADSTVAVQVDGLHVQMVGPVAPNEQLAFYGRDDYFVATEIETFGSGTYAGVFTRPASVGVYDVKCYPKGIDPATINAATMVRVIDPNNFWTSTNLSCPIDSRGAVSSADQPQPTEESAVRALSGVVASDAVEPAGYTQDRADRQRYTDYAVWRVVRNGEIVAWTWVHGADGSWQAVHGVACVSAGIGQASRTSTATNP